LNERAHRIEIRAFANDLDSRIDAVGAPSPSDPYFPFKLDDLIMEALEDMYDEDFHTKVSEVIEVVIIELILESDPVHEALKAIYFRDPSSIGPATEDVKTRGITLEQNYPNPFDQYTGIRYSIHQRLHTRLTVYDHSGREIAVLVNENKDPGYYEITFDASDMPEGVYILRLQAGQYEMSRKILIVK